MKFRDGPAAVTKCYEDDSPLLPLLFGSLQLELIEKQREGLVSLAWKSEDLPILFAILSAWDGRLLLFHLHPIWEKDTKSPAF